MKKLFLIIVLMLAGCCSDNRVRIQTKMEPYYKTADGFSKWRQVAAILKIVHPEYPPASHIAADLALAEMNLK